jgi:hypothetical protein
MVAATPSREGGAGAGRPPPEDRPPQRGLRLGEGVGVERPDIGRDPLLGPLGVEAIGFHAIKRGIDISQPCRLVLTNADGGIRDREGFPDEPKRGVLSGDHDQRRRVMGVGIAATLL